MFLLHRKGLKLDGANPALMTAYGGFNVSLTPQFSPSAILWAEQGGVFAVPNLRGRGVAAVEPLHEPGQAGGNRAQQRRPAHGREHRPAARFVSRHRVRLSL